jgi:hypothetical protein
MTIARAIAAIMLLSSSSSALAGESQVMAVYRNNATNYKDRALAACISEAYKGSPAGQDASKTFGVSLEWTYYDLEKGNPAVDKLVNKYLRRDYSLPFEGCAGAKFDLLKCLDMYHSKELDEQVRKYVSHPNWIGDKPPRHKRN